MPKRFQDNLERYPGVLAALFLCSGIIVASRADLPLSVWFLAALLPILPLVLVAQRAEKKPLLWCAVGALFFVLGLCLTTERLNPREGIEPSVQKCVIHATVAKTWARGPDFRTLLVYSGRNVTQGTSLPGAGRLLIRHNKVPLCAGDRIAFQSRIRTPLNRGNPGEYDWETDCKNEGILWLASVRGEDSVAVLKRGSSFLPGAILFRAREAMAGFLETHSGRFLGESSAKPVKGILKGIIVGDMGDIDPDLNRDFVDSGLVHALSASGLHVAIVAFLTLMLVKVGVRAVPSVLLWLPLRKLAALACIPAVVTYCLLVGARVPAVRSMIMGLVVATAILLDKKWHSFNSLALAGIIILLIYPLSLFTPSFQLSFASVAGILLMVSPVMSRLYGKDSESTLDSVDAEGGRHEGLGRLLHGLRPLTAVALTSAAATIAVLPFLVQTFHSFPVYTVFANLASDFMITGALSIGLLATAVGVGLPEVGSWVLAPAAFLTLMIIKIASFFSALPGSTVLIPHMGTTEFVVATGIAFFMLWYVRGPLGRKYHVISASGLALVAVVAIPPWVGPDADLEVRFLNVGKGDAAFVRAPGTRGLLIDGGVANEHFDCGRSIVAPFLKWNGNRSLDGILISHPQMDHMGGVLAVIGRMPPSRVWWNPVDVQSSYLDAIVAAARAEGAMILPADRHQEPVRLGGATLRFLNRSCPRGKGRMSHYEVNDASVVCRVEYGDVSFLFTGDIEREGERELLAAGVPLAATVLKVAHHGGKTSTNRDFLEAVRPKIAVISCDGADLGAFPNQQVVERLASAGVQIFITGRDGAVTVRTDGRDLRYEVGRAGKGKRKEEHSEPFAFSIMKRQHATAATWPLN
ncbi:MAG: DNA internalization-related competence protein ComEC/Rec2 [Desulfomonile tiedjei]|nr:DNA internalization-related competence protein ComEC/Rec2 [Desulfomonile tiedjei]